MPARVKGKDLMHLSRQLAAFLRAGIPILDGLTLLAEDTANKTLRRTLDDVAERLRQGSPLGEAFDHHPKVFPQAYRSMVRSAELTGSLDVVLDRLTIYVERDVEARRKIKSAMSYPIVVVVLSISVSTLLVTFVLPKFRVFFGSFHQQLPLPIVGAERHVEFVEQERESSLEANRHVRTRPLPRAPLRKGTDTG